MKYEKMLCWVTKTHEKEIRKEFESSFHLQFIRSLSDFLSATTEGNFILIVSLSKVSSKKSIEALKPFNSIFYMEKKGLVSNNMMDALMNSDNHFMVGLSDIKTIIS